MILRQFLDPVSSTFSYVIGDRSSGEAMIIDPVLEHAELYLRFIQEWALKLCYSIDTHTHADHVTAANKLKVITGCCILVGQHSQAVGADQRFTEGDRVSVGELQFQVLYTPGHTDDCYSLYGEGCVFTGDALLIRSTGRTDFQSGDAKQAYRALTEKLLSLPDDTWVYPAHDYKVLNRSTIGEEKRFNPRLQIDSAEAYATIMDNLNLAKPKLIDIVVPANLKCGDISDDKENQHV